MILILLIHIIISKFSFNKIILWPLIDVSLLFDNIILSTCDNRELFRLHYITLFDCYIEPQANHPKNSIPFLFLPWKTNFFLDPYCWSLIMKILFINFFEKKWNTIFYCAAWCGLLSEQNRGNFASVPKVAYNFHTLLVLKAAFLYLVIFTQENNRLQKHDRYL